MRSGLVTDFNEEHLKFAEKYLQEFIIVWLTDNIINTNETSDKLQIFVGLQKTAQNIYRVYDINSCLATLGDNSHQSVFLIIGTNDSINEGDYSKLCSFINVEYIYHFGCTDPCKKTRGDVSNDLSHLSQDKSFLHILPLKLLDTHMKYLNGETQKFIIRQLLIEILQHGQCTLAAREIFVMFCRQTYGNDNVRLEQIDEYEQYFSPNCSIWWYTKNTFAFRILNKTLRENNLNSMFKIKYYICGLYDQLNDLYISQLKTFLKSKLKLYRGKMIS